MLLRKRGIVFLTFFWLGVLGGSFDICASEGEEEYEKVCNPFCCCAWVKNLFSLKIHPVVPEVEDQIESGVGIALTSLGDFGKFYIQPEGDKRRECFKQSRKIIKSVQAQPQTPQEWAEAKSEDRLKQRVKSLEHLGVLIVRLQECMEAFCKIDTLNENKDIQSLNNSLNRIDTRIKFLLSEEENGGISIAGMKRVVDSVCCSLTRIKHSPDPILTQRHVEDVNDALEEEYSLKDLRDLWKMRKEISKSYKTLSKAFGVSSQKKGNLIVTPPSDEKDEFANNSLVIPL